MLTALLVVLVLGGATGVYALARRRYALDRQGSAVLAGAACLISTVVAIVAPGTSLPRDAADVGPATGGYAAGTAQPSGLTSESESPTPVAAVARTPIPLARTPRLKLEPGAASGGVDYGLIAPPDRGSYDAAKHAIELRSGATATLGGWSADIGAKTVYGGIVLLSDGKIVATASYGGDRLDVARYYHAPGLRHCGFQVVVPVLGKGRHTLALGAVDTAGTSYTLIPASYVLRVDE